MAVGYEPAVPQQRPDETLRKRQTFGTGHHAVHTSRAHLFSWETFDSVGSDHLPTLISTDFNRPTIDKTKKMNLNNTDRAHCEELFSKPWPAGSLEADNKRFVALVLEAAKKSSPVSSNRATKPWWTEACTKAKKECSQALRYIKRDPCSSSLVQAYQSARKKLDTTIQTEKAKCWRSFAAELRPSTPSTNVWKTLRAMDGRSKADVKNQPIENDAGKIFTTDMDKANGMTKEYASVSHAKIDRADSKAAYEVVRKSLRVPVDESLDLNNGFSNMELTSAILKLKKGPRVSTRFTRSC